MYEIIEFWIKQYDIELWSCVKGAAKSNITPYHNLIVHCYVLYFIQEEFQTVIELLCTENFDKFICLKVYDIKYKNLKMP